MKKFKYFLITAWIFFFLSLFNELYCQNVSVVLSWDPNQEQDLAGYKIYKGIESGHYTETIIIGIKTSYTFNVDTQYVHYFALTAYDTADNESSFSEEVNTDEVTSVESNITPKIDNTLKVYPNPFNKKVVINFMLPEQQNNAILKVYNMRGELVDRIQYNRIFTIGKNNILWYPDKILPSGCYILSLNCGVVSKSIITTYLK